MNFERLIESEMESVEYGTLIDEAQAKYPDLGFYHLKEGKVVLSDGIKAVVYESDEKQDKYSIATLIENEDYDTLAELNEGNLAKFLSVLGGWGTAGLTMGPALYTLLTGSAATAFAMPIIGLGVGALAGYGIGKGVEGVAKLFTHSTLRRTMKDLQELVVKRDALVAEIGQAEDKKQAERERKSEIQSLTRSIKQKGMELNREVERMGGIDALDVSAKQSRKIQDFLNAAEDGAVTGFPSKK